MRIFKKIMFALILMASAVLILLEALGILHLGFNVIEGILAAFLTVIFFDSLIKRNFFPMLVAPALICVIFSEPLGLQAITPWPILISAALVGIALTILFGGHHGKNCHSCDHMEYDSERDFKKEIIDGDESIIEIDTSFGAVAKYINTKKLEKISINLKFGAAKIYLDNADIKGDTAVIDFHTTFSGTELYVPKEWKVANQTSASFGSIDEKNKPSANGKKTLKIVGSVSFAGVEVIYV